ncbi:MAG: cyclic nucleotide-binding domain-containing protein [Acidobacteriota bacterium]
MTKAKFKTTSAKSAPAHYTAEFASDSFIFTEGELGTHMYIIQDGKVEIMQRVAGEDRRVAVLEKGDFFGEMAVLEDLPRNASARTLSDTRLLQIDSSTFDQMLKDNPEIGVRMMRKLSRRLRETDTLLREYLGTSESSPIPEMPSPEAGPAAVSKHEVLRHAESGMEFPLAAGAETMIGRKDPVTGIFPDVDLAPIDTQRSISRRHAKIYRRNDKLYLSEEIGTMNGTFVNQTRLVKGVPAEIKAGDEVRCGVINLQLEVG